MSRRLTDNDHFEIVALYFATRNKRGTCAIRGIPKSSLNALLGRGKINREIARCGSIDAFVTAHVRERDILAVQERLENGERGFAAGNHPSKPRVEYFGGSRTLE